MNKILNEAASLIEESGWCQMSYQNANGAYCIVGAMSQVATGNHNRDWDYETRYAKFLMELQVGRHPISWNDQDGRSKDDVILNLRSAAKKDNWFNRLRFIMSYN